LTRTAGAEIVSAKLFLQQLVAVDNPFSTLNLHFRWESFTAFAHRLKKMAVRRIVRGLFVAWYTSELVRVAVTDTCSSERFTGIKPED